jgi:hypothetical protein
MIEAPETRLPEVLWHLRMMLQSVEKSQILRSPTARVISDRMWPNDQRLATCELLLLGLGEVLPQQTVAQYPVVKNCRTPGPTCPHFAMNPVPTGLKNELRPEYQRDG